MTEIKNNYDVSQIQVLEGLEAVRKRPAMYIGDTSIKGLHHLVSEVVDNCIDEALAGYGRDIEVFILPGNTIKVVDTGRGVPVETHQPKKKRSALDVVMTVLHSGGKTDKRDREVSFALPNARCRTIDLFAGCGGFDLAFEPLAPMTGKTVIARAIAEIISREEMFTPDIITDQIYEEDYPLAASTGDDAVPIVMPESGLIYNNGADNQTAWFDAGRGSGGLPYLPLPTLQTNQIIHNKHYEYPLLIPKIITASERNGAANSQAA